MSTCDPRDVFPTSVGGTYGSTGQYLVAGGGLTISSGPSWQSLDLDLASNKEFKEIKSKIEAIEQRLAILVPNEDLQKRFPALQEAYDHYKLIEKLVNDKNKQV